MTDEEKFMQMMHEKLNRKAEEMNATPRDEMDNLSPNDMYQILYHTFEDKSPVGIKKEIPSAVLDKVPFMQLTKAYLSRIDEAGEFKLTKIGNLPRQLCLDLYGLGFIKEYILEQSWGHNLNKEADSMTLVNLKNINHLAGITKKRNGKLSLTAKGKKIMATDQQNALFKEIFTTNIQKFNLGYHDGYPQESPIQRLFGYTIYLLLQYGQEIRKFNFYVEKYVAAFPDLLIDFPPAYRTSIESFASCYWVRFFERFLRYYGFIEFKKEGALLSFDEQPVKASALFYEIFELKKENFRFKISQHQA